MSVQDAIKNFNSVKNSPLIGAKPLLGPKPFEKPKSLPRKIQRPNIGTAQNNNNNNGNNVAGSTTFTAGDIQRKLSEITSKRTLSAPPLASSQEQEEDATPEFLRRPLKKVGVLSNGSENRAKEESVHHDSKASPTESPKINFRNSILLFEQNITKKPEVQPKPRSFSKTSNHELADPGKKQESDAKSTENIFSMLVAEQLSTSLISEENNSSKPPLKGEKPLSYTLSDVPKGLDKWIQNIVLERGLSTAAPLLDRSNKPGTKTFGESTAQETTSAGYVEELYDDVGGTLSSGELYDDAAAVQQYEQSEQLYDDVENVLPEQQGMAGGEELYDDASIPSQMESTNDPALQQNGNTLLEEELYDDVGAGEESTDQQDVDAESFDGQEVYEPVENVKIYVENISKTQDTSKETNEAKDDKKLKKEKQREEKKKKKEEQEKRKREEQERKRQEKERKQFNLKESEIVSMERHITIKEYKGKGKELSFGNGELIDIIMKEGCPKGKWLARSMDGRLGYINLKFIGLEGDYERTFGIKGGSAPCSISVDGDGELLYEEVGRDIPPPVPASPRRPKTPTMPRTGGEEEGEDIYEAI